MNRKIKRYGWIRDLPDNRDHLYVAPPQILASLPPSVDLRSQCPPVYDQGQLGSCHDDMTEVLTERGWQKFKDITMDDKLATVDPITQKMIFEHPTRIIRFNYKGDVYCADRVGLNFKVTPDHKMLVRKWDQSKKTLSKKYEFVEAKNLGWYSGLMNRINWDGVDSSDKQIIPGVQHKTRPSQRTEKIISMESWMRFLGIYLAEGSLLVHEKEKHRYKIQIAASKEREKQFIRKILQDIGIHALELDDRFTFENKQIYELLTSYELEGVKASFKFVPQFVFRQKSQLIKEFLSGHFHGDGSEYKSGGRAHYTSSKQLAEDLQLAIFLSGDESHISTRPPRMSIMTDGRMVNGQFDEHRVSVCEIKNLSIERMNDITIEQYDGEVFCAEVPTYHTLVTRREGEILISGNCTANAIAGAVEFDLIKEQQKRIFVPSRLFLYYNERVIEGTPDTDSGAEIRDGIKSVASQGDCPEDIWPYDITKFAIKPPAQCYQSAKQYEAVKYQRLQQDLNQLKGCLASGYPFVFGFTVYSSFESQQVATTGHAPMPQPGEEAIGGHAVVAVGFDDSQQWFLVRNSWGESWGMKGYFTMPYTYLLDQNLSSDFWTISVVS